MKKHSLFIILCFLSTAYISAQSVRWSVKGMVTDSAGAALEAGTVVLLKVKDSSLVSFGRTNDSGVFELKNIKTNDEYFIKITYLGYIDFTRKIGPTVESPMIDLGTIRMQDQSQLLKEVVISEQHTPMQIKKDTLEFNSAAFKTQPNANVEDMIKKMPGMEVDKDGNITSQGKTVTQVLVDGKKFFGKDPKIATRNLPADAIEKVQVFDKKSDQSEFSGIDDGERETTINLKLKSNAKRGTFGSLGAAVGTEGRFESRASINKFDGKRQWSFIGMANNLNQTGFSISDYMSFSGDAQRMMGGQGGVRMMTMGNGGGGGSDQSIPIDFGGTRRGTGTSYAGGLNFNQSLSKTTELNASYFYNFSDTYIKRIADRETFYEVGNLLDHSETKQDNERQTHRLTTQIDQKIDSLSSLRFNGNLSFNDNLSTLLSASNQSNSIASLNRVARNTTTNSDALNLQGTLLYRLKFNKRGRFFSTTLNANTNDNNTDADYRTVTQYLTGVSRADSIFQNTLKTNDRRMYSVQASFTEPVAKRRYLELNASHRETNTNYNQLVYDLLVGRSLNSRLSNNYRNLYSYNRVGMNYRIAEKEINITGGLNLQQSLLNGRQSAGENKPIKKDFVNLVPTVRMEYDLQNGRNLSVNYEGSVREPSIDQISPITDNSNPRYVSLGNPDLRTEYSHNLNLNYRKFNFANFTNFFAFAGMTYNLHPIVYSQRIDQQFITYTKPVNLDSNTINFFSNVNYGFQIKPAKLRVNTSMGLNGMQSYSLVQSTQNKINTRSVNGRLNLEFRPGDYFEWTNGIRRAWNNTRYSINNQNNQKSHTTTLTSDILVNYKGFVFTSSLNYYIYRGLSQEFNQDVPILGATLSKTFLKSKRLEFKLTANDILKRNTGINRTSNINYIEDEQVNTLTRYFLIGVNYILKGTPGMMQGPRRGGGMPRMIMN